MTSYLFVESRSALESPDVEALLDVLGGLRAAGHDVDLFLVQNGALMSTPARPPALAALAAGGVTVWADDFSLSSRGIAPADVAPGTRVAGAAELVELVMRPGCVPVWH